MKLRNPTRALWCGPTSCGPCYGIKCLLPKDCNNCS